MILENELSSQPLPQMGDVPNVPEPSLVLLACVTSSVQRRSPSTRLLFTSSERASLMASFSFSEFAMWKSTGATLMLLTIATTSASLAVTPASLAGAFTLSNIVRCLAVTRMRPSASAGSAPNAAFFRSLHVAKNALFWPTRHQHQAIFVGVHRAHTGLCPLLPAPCYEVGRQARRGYLYIAFAGNGELPRVVGRSHRCQQDVLDFPPKRFGLHLEPRPDALNTRNGLTGEHLQRSHAATRSSKSNPGPAVDRVVLGLADFSFSCFEGFFPLCLEAL